MTIDEKNIHVIRLRAPWEYRIVGGQIPNHKHSASTSPPPPSGTIRRTDNWRRLLDYTSGGTIELQRYFNRPTGLLAEDRIDLVFSQIPLNGLVHLNGECIGTLLTSDARKRINVTSRLLGRNLLVVELQSLAEPSPKQAASPTQLGPLADEFLDSVQLEIFSTSVDNEEQEKEAE